MENYEKTFQSNIIIKRHFVSVRKRKRERKLTIQDHPRPVISR